jgi:hypothetical protein
MSLENTSQFRDVPKLGRFGHPAPDQSAKRDQKAKDEKIFSIAKLSAVKSFSDRDIQANFTRYRPCLFSRSTPEPVCSTAVLNFKPSLDGESLVQENRNA